MKTILFCGESNFTGFKIRDTWLKITIKSEKYIEKYLRYLFFIYLTLAILIILSLQIINGIILLGIVITICILIWTYNELREWHAAEHMLVYALNNNGELNLENLKKAPMKSKVCGNKNKTLRKPSDKKLEKTLRVGLEYLKKREEIRKPRKIITKIKHNEASPDASIFLKYPRIN